MPLSDRIILVTGGTQGVGREVALQAARAGAAGVVICGRQQERGRQVQLELQALGCAAEYVEANLASADDCRRVVAQCDRAFGRVDGLVNAAADSTRSTLDETTVDLWDRLFAINVRAPFLLTQEAARVMRRQNIAGCIVNVISFTAYCGPANLTAYSSSKGALLTLTKNTANALRRDRIRVNGIVLGWTDTPAEHAVQRAEGKPEDWLETAERHAPFGRLLKPLDVARMCLFLLSDQSGILTGSTIDYCQRVTGFYPPETGLPE